MLETMEVELFMHTSMTLVRNLAKMVKKNLSNFVVMTFPFPLLTFYVLEILAKTKPRKELLILM